MSIIGNAEAKKLTNRLATEARRAMVALGKIVKKSQLKRIDGKVLQGMMQEVNKAAGFINRIVQIFEVVD